MRFSLLAIVLATVGLVSCSNDSVAPPKAFVSAQVGPGNDKDASGNPTNGASQCQLTTMTWISIGTETTSVETGSAQGSAQVDVACSVKASGSVFAVSASATLSQAGTLSLSGNFTGTGTQTPIRATFVRADTGTFRETDCTVEYAAGTNQGVASGKVWGKLNCPALAFTTGQDRTCLGQAEFRFENCDQ